MENRDEEYLELSDSELSTSFSDKGPSIVQALVYRRGDKRRPEFLLNHAPFTHPLRRFLRLLQLLVEHEGTKQYDRVVTTMTCLVGKMERTEVTRLKDICDKPDKIKSLFLAISTNIEWSDKFIDAFALVAHEVDNMCVRCLEHWSTVAHSSPMYWEMPSARLPDPEDCMDDVVPIACQAVLDQAGFHVRPHPIIKPVTYVNKDTETSFTVCLCQITGEEKTYDTQDTHRMFFPLNGALQHLRDPGHPDTALNLKHFHSELYKLDQALMDKRQAARRLSDDSFICSPSPIDDSGRKRRMSSSSETSDGRSPKSPCTKSPVHRRPYPMKPPPSFSGGVKPITEMPSLNKDPRLKSAS